jgi:hypothetical protein
VFATTIVLFPRADDDDNKAGNRTPSNWHTVKLAAPLLWIMRRRVIR